MIRSSSCGTEASPGNGRAVMVSGRSRWVGGLARPVRFAVRHFGDVGKREPFEHRTHRCAHVLPDSEQDALTLVIARASSVRFAEVAKRDGSIDGSNDLSQRDVCRRTGEDVAAADAALGSNDAGTLEGEQDLFQVRLG